MSDNLKQIYEKGKRTDFVLKIGDESICTHRMILETRSPVFAAMLNYDTHENQTGEVSIKDMDKSAIDAILLYIYSGDIDKLMTENVISIYAAAEKYDIKNVKEMCVKFMLRNLSVEWVCDVIKFAYLYNEAEVSECVRQYFKKNSVKILQSEEWKAFIKESSEIVLNFLSLF